MKTLRIRQIVDTKHWEVELNGEAISFAYTYFFRDGQWKNLALTMGLPSLGDVPETLSARYKPIDAETLINRCLSLSQEDRDSGITGRMRAGTDKSTKCLEDAIVENASALFVDKVYSAQQMRDDLSKVRQGLGNFIWKLYNENADCSPSCGTMYTTFASASVEDKFEQLLKEVVAQRNQLKK